MPQLIDIKGTPHTCFFSKTTIYPGKELVSQASRILVGGAREGKNTSGDYRQDFVSLCRNLCRRISVQQSCDNAQCCVTNMSRARAA